MSVDDPRRHRSAPVELKWPSEPEDASPPEDHHETVSYAILNLLAGTWLIISPWVAGYHDDDPWWNPILCGMTVATFGLVRAMVPAGTRLLSWFNAGVGVWLFASGFWLATSAMAAWNAGILGVVVFVVASLSLSVSRLRE